MKFETRDTIQKINKIKADSLKELIKSVTYKTGAN